MQQLATTGPRMQMILLALAALAALTGRSALAADPPAVNTSEWACNECPFSDDGKTNGDVELGAISVSDDAARFGRYTGLDEEGVHPVLSGTVGQSRADGRYWRAEAQNIGIDSAELSLQGGKPGLDVAIGYRQQPNHLFDTTRSPFAVSSPGVLTLPSGWVRAINTTQMSSLSGALKPVDIETERRALSARLRAVLGERWTSYADYKHESRDGTWRQAAGFGFSAIELLKPIDDINQTLALGFRYTGPRLTAQFGYDGSFYSNRRVAVSWDNPYVGPSRGQLAQAPDNSANQVSGTLNYRVADNTALSLMAAFGELRQDDAFLPYTINALPLTPALPRRSLDGKVRTTHVALTLSAGLDSLASWLRGANMKLDVRYDDRDNNTPVAAYAYVVTDQFTSAPASNDPYSFKNQRVLASGGYDLRQLLRFIPDSQRLRISGGWRHDEITRSLQEARDVTEDTGWGRVRWQPAGWLDINVKWGGANRSIDQYLPVGQIVAPQNPLLRKYNMADRERQFAEGTVTLQPLAKWSMTATGRYANASYINSKLGLLASREEGATFGTNWAATDKLTLFADYGWQSINARQAGSAAYSVRDWSANSIDRFRSGSAGLRVVGLAKGVDLDVHGFFANSDGDTTLTTPSVDRLPTLRTRSNGGEVALSWRRSGPLSLRAALRYEHFDADDYSLDGVLPATVPTLLSLGAQAYDFDVVSAMLSVRYRFGAEAAGGDEEAAKSDKDDAKE